MGTKIFILVIMLFSVIFNQCGPDKRRNIPLKSRIKFNQYYVNGKRLYGEFCSNCHQYDGSGLARLYPPIYTSEFFNSDPDRTICIIRHGLKGEIIVNGDTYNQPMPENLNLTHLEIAELVTYLYSSRYDEYKLFSAAEVAEALQNCH
jgi:mono/diheme cytochrome c family protein